MCRVVRVAWLILLLAIPVGHATDFPRTNYFSSLSYTGPGSLFQAIADAQTSNIPTRIVPAGVTGTIFLGSLPTITGTIWLDLSGITISGGTTGVVTVASNAQCRISGLQLSSVIVSETDGSPAALVNKGTLLLDRCIFRQNENHSGYGGAILNHGSLTILNCQFVTNLAAAHRGGWGGSTINGFGGAIYQDGASLQIADSTFEGNSVQYGYYAGSFAGDPTTYGDMQGGALYVASGSVSLSRVSLIGNHTDLDLSNRVSGSGGAIAVAGGELAATNCTFARNVVHGRNAYQVYIGQGRIATNQALSCYGGAIYAVPWTTNFLIHCTLSENESRGGDQGAAWGYGGAIYGNADLKACVVTANYAEAGSDVYGVTTLGKNVIGDANGVASWLGSDIFGPAAPILDPIKKTIDEHWYYSLPPLSPARDIASVTIIEDELLHARPIGDFSDAGAYEGEYLPPTIITQPPEAVVLTPGSRATVDVTASGTRPLNYDLMLGTNVIRSFSDGLFTFNETDTPGTYKIRISNAAGSATSQPITLTFNNGLSFARQPTSQTVSLAGAADLSTTVTGIGRITYQWFHNGSPLPSATNSFLKLFPIENSDLGEYTVQASNGPDTITSEIANIALSSPIYVSNLDDSGPGSLRDAIEKANAQAPATIAISLTNSGTLLLDSPLDVTGNIAITNIADALILSGQRKSTFMHIQTNGSAILHNLRIAHFHAAPPQNGGALWNEGDLTLNHCTLTDCSSAFGGAIFNAGNLVLFASTLYNNSGLGADGLSGNGAGGGGAGMGGAVYQARGSAALTNVTISGNVARGGGSGAFVFAQPPGLGGNAASSSSSSPAPQFGRGGNGGYAYEHIAYSPIAGSYVTTDYPAGRAGGLGAGGGGGHSVPVQNGTSFGAGSLGGFGAGDGPTNLTNDGSANDDPRPHQPDPRGGGGAGLGAAIFVESGSVTLSHCTIVSNTVSGGAGYNNGRGIGGGIFVLTGDTRIQNSILSQNSAGDSPDAFGPITSVGGNLLGSFVTWATNDLVISSPGLAPLSSDGTAPAIHNLLPGSPAIDNGFPLFEPSTDESGNPRFQGKKPDSGAVESIGQLQFSLSTDVVGAGTVLSSEARAFFLPGESVTLNAVPSPNQRFIRWIGDFTGSNPQITLQMDSSKRVAAVFSGAAILTEVLGSGTVEISPEKALYADAEFVRLIPIPAPGWILSGWSGDASGDFNPLIIQTSGHRRVVAIFSSGSPPTYSLDVVLNNERATTAAFDLNNGIYFIESFFEAPSTLNRVDASGALRSVGTVSFPYVSGLVVRPDGKFYASSGDAVALLDTNAVLLARVPASAAAYPLGEGIRLIYASRAMLLAPRDSSPVLPLEAELSGEMISTDDSQRTTNGYSQLSIYKLDETALTNLRLPPALSRPRCLPLLDGFVCVGLYDTNATAAPRFVATNEAFFVAKLSPKALPDWILFGNANVPASDIFGYPIPAAFDLAVDASGQWIYFAIASSGFFFNGMSYPPAPGSRIFKIDLDGQICSMFVVGATAPFQGFGASTAGSIYVLSGNSILAYFAPFDPSAVSLSATPVANGLELSWPANPLWLLQHRTSLDSTSSWTDYPVSPSTDGSTYRLDTLQSAHTQFFRLRR